MTITDSGTVEKAEAGTPERDIIWWVREVALGPTCDHTWLEMDPQRKMLLLPTKNWEEGQD